MKKLVKVSGLVLTFITIALFLTGCKSDTHKSSDKINVATTTNFYAEPAKAVLGDHGKVSSLVNSGVNPHEFTPKNSDAKVVNEANVVVENGLGYDEWMSKLYSNHEDDIDVINVGKLMHKQDGDNEHIWYNPATMGKLADKLADTYSKIQPSHKKEFHQNAEAYKAKLKKTQDLAKKLAANSHGQKVDVSEPVFNYSLEAMGYKINDDSFANAIEKDVDPSPKALAKVRDDIKNKRIAFFVENTQEENKTIASLVKLAKENDIPVVKVTETIPANTNYFDWMNSQYEQIEKIQNH
ncbi:metal ABC transporter solute-binding protein, Zn/Mn family [Fructilactobacillus sp. Tb1]|uniref:metal ABC transporter solute-binding protein, Zn/Mn family n=1 Tax=Fructilactobacillus sp. Tb1 TaxID=3422304 RepID=UPI003D287574